MKKNIDHKRNIIYLTVAAALFATVGLLQGLYDYVDGSSNRIIMSIVANIILIGLAIFWLVLINNRIVHKRQRAAMVLSATFIVFWMLIRFIKYQFFIGDEVTTRYLWYAYYIPQLMISTLLFFFVCQIGVDDKKPFDKRWLILFIPAMVLVLLVFTNDFHQLVFKFKPNFVNANNDYTYGPLYYVIVVYQTAIILISFIIEGKKCRVSKARRQMWVPFACMIIGITASLICLLVTNVLYKLPELHCVTFVAFMESCIQIGLVPSNSGYDTYFKKSGINATITDDNGTPLFSSGDVGVPSDVKSNLTETGGMLDDNTKLSVRKINGGYILWSDDLSNINELNDEIKEIKESLSEENVLIKAENELKEQMATVLESQKLYEKIETAVKPQIDEINALLESVNADSANVAEVLGKVGILGAYIKRRSNLTIIAEKDDMLKVTEIALCIKESLDYLLLSGINCALAQIGNAEVDRAAALCVYDCFELIAEAVCKSDNGTLAVYVTANNGEALFRFVTDNVSLITDTQTAVINKSGGTVKSYLSDNERYIDIRLIGREVL